MRLPVAVVRRSVQTASWPVTGAGLSFAHQRRLYAAAAAVTRPPRGTTVTHETYGDVDCLRVVAAGADPTRCMVHFHGGGFCIGSAFGHRGFASYLSDAAGVAVVLPDYRLAPEHTYPAAHDDAEHVWRSLAPTAVAVSGDSAGGNLALSVAVRMRESGGAMPPAVVLISPGLDRAADRRANPELIAADIMLTPQWLDACFGAYWSSAAGAVELNLVEADLRDLPPTLVIAGTAELLLPDADRFSERARVAGVDVTDVRGEGLWHIYPTQAGMLAAADAAVERIGYFVRQAAWRG